MSYDENDEDIIASYKNGEKVHFKKLVDKYTTPLFNFTARLTNRSDAEDIVQEVFIKVWKNIKNFDENKASFKTWIFTIAKNATTDFQRKKKSLLFSDMPTRGSGEKNTDGEISNFEENIPGEDLLPDADLQKLQDKEFLDKILDQLRPHYKEVLVLHYQEEMTFEEIGKVLNKPLNTVKSSHRRAIIELRKMISASPL